MNLFGVLVAALLVALLVEFSTDAWAYLHQRRTLRLCNRHRARVGAPPLTRI